MGRLRAYLGLQRTILSHHPSEKTSATICIDKLNGIDAAEDGRDVGRCHLPKEDQQLSVSKRLARKRMLGSAFHEMCDVPIGKPN